MPPPTPLNQCISYADWSLLFSYPQALSELKIGGDEKEKLVDVSSDDMTISYLAARNPFVSVSESCSLADLCAALVEKHCHRVPIVDKETGKCTNIISQSALVKFLAKNGESKRNVHGFAIINLMH